MLFAYGQNLENRGMNEDIRRHLPLNPKILMILLSVGEGPAHGYEIKKCAETQSRGSVRLDAGSLYRSLAQLVKRELIEEVPADLDTEGDDPRRRYYQISSLGRTVLRAELDRLSEIMDVARSANLLEPAGGSQ